MAPFDEIWLENVGKSGLDPNGRAGAVETILDAVDFAALRRWSDRQNRHAEDAGFDDLLFRQAVHDGDPQSAPPPSFASL